jgi:hypothetical protein
MIEAILRFVSPVNGNIVEHAQRFTAQNVSNIQDPELRDNPHSARSPRTAGFFSELSKPNWLAGLA